VSPASRRVGSSVAPSSVSLPVGTWKALGPAPIGYEPVSCLCTSTVPEFVAGGGKFGDHNSGRVTSLVAIPSGAHAGRIVAGSAGGGVWTSDDAALTWTPRTDQAPSLAIGSLAEDPSNPDHLIAGMGEGHSAPGLDGFYGFGILSSTDGGTTWTVQNPGGVFNNTHIPAVAIENSKQMYAGTSTGLFVTTDGGSTWTQPPSVAGVVGAGNEVDAVVVDPLNPATVFIGARGPSVSLAESTDRGVTWSAANSCSSCPGGKVVPACAACGADVALAIAPSNPNVLYASLGSGVGGGGPCCPVALYQTTDASNPPPVGPHWKQLTSAPDYTGNDYSYGGTCGTSAGANCEQGGYDNVVVVDPANASHVLAGGETVVESPDVTTNQWNNVNGQQFNTPKNALHPDQHALAFGPDGKVWIGDDGGVYLYDPVSKKISNGNGRGDHGLEITQFYPGFFESDGFLFGGAQDNAEVRLEEPIRGPFTPWYSQGVDCCDAGGAAVVVDPDPNCVCELNFWVRNKGLYRADLNFKHVAGITPPGTGAPFIPPMLVVPNNTDWSSPTVFFGMTDLWRTTNPSASPPSWTRVTGIAQKVTAITVSPTNPQVVYVGFYDGTVEVSTDGGATFTKLAASPFACGANCAAQQVTGLSVDPTNPQAITASFGGNLNSIPTRTSQSAPEVAQYPATPGGGTWAPITGNLASVDNNAAVSHVIYDQGALLAATDSGVYGSVTAAGPSTSWSKIGSGLPNVQVQDIAVDPATQDLYVVTHGRGAWVLSANGAQAWGYSSFGGLGDGSTTSGDPNCGPSCSDVARRVLAGSTQKVTPLLRNVTGVAEGYSNGLAVLSNGTVASWGWNDTGQLGDGTTANSDLPALVCADGATAPCGNNVLSGVTAVAAGDPGSQALSNFGGDGLALLKNGTVVAWGLNEDGELGDGTITNSSVPVQVCAVGAAAPCKDNVLSGVTAIAAGGGHNLALLNNGTVVAWGLNSEGELGTGSAIGPDSCFAGDSCSKTPVAVAGLTNVKAVSAGYLHGLALLNDGTVWAWGRGTDGELGSGTSNTTASPTQVCAAGASAPCGTFLTGVSAVAAGNGYSLGLLSSGTVLSWGDNTNCELGDGSCGTGTNRYVPGAVCAVGATAPCGTNVLTGAYAISAGLDFVTALTNDTIHDGAARSWGYGGNGEIDRGIPFSAATPVIACQAGSPSGNVCGVQDELAGVTNIAAGGVNALASVG
jgi:hypothetical protein